MDVVKGREIVALYRDNLGSIPAVPISKAQIGEPHWGQAFEHVQDMLNQMDRFLDTVEARGSEWETSWDKFNRWLGFAQGVFWAHGEYTLPVMREHNRTEV